MEKIENALEMSDNEERCATLNEGREILVQRNKPQASDSDDNKKICRAIKESKAVKEEKRKSARTVVKPQSAQS